MAATDIRTSWLSRHPSLFIKDAEAELAPPMPMNHRKFLEECVPNRDTPIAVPVGDRTCAAAIWAAW